MITFPGSDHLFVVIGGRAATGRLLELAARVALRGPLLMLDCGNHANPLPLARELRRLTRDPVHVLERVQVARAFTCYQVVALLEQPGSFPAQSSVLIFDLLASFYDESVSYIEGRCLLEKCLDCITRIRRVAPLLVSAQAPPADFPERRAFVEMLCRVADRYWIEEAPPTPAPPQLSLPL